MIEAGYVRIMARYNAWQNRQLTEMLTGVPDVELRKDRGAFFGSIMATLNHILWGDAMWMSRLDPKIPAPRVPAEDHKDFTPTFAVWTAERFRMDGTIRLWADDLDTIALKGDLSWYSGMLKRDFHAPFEVCVTHLFTHQAHHRGQVHAMMTAAGLSAPVTDIVFMPEDD
ncbi:damage-inducible protein DinB [Tateyamaria omphalii]|uniref:DinB family protein n=1 Tax=Tateyamaria omphalii TaxID=299262 RepID=UPI001672D587|nr:DinB family protein [Tateyamaria omphalii]GGX45698.1 damage-inducible protein DinB [Tateyamaria omphalii]